MHSNLGEEQNIRMQTYLIMPSNYVDNLMDRENLLLSTPVLAASKVRFSHCAQSYVYRIFKPSKMWSSFGAHLLLHSERRSKISMTGSRLIDLMLHVSARFFSDILTQSILFTLGTNSFELTYTRTHIHLRPGQTFLPIPFPSFISLLPNPSGAHHVRIPNIQRQSMSRK